MIAHESPSPEPKLEAPGAGLPFPDRFIVRYLVGPFLSKLTPPEKSRGYYEGVTQTLIHLVEGVPVHLKDRKVLVSKMPGLEDSSRYWSINRVVEHLLIVGKSIEGVILSLSAGKVPDGKADVAKVKPTNLISDPFSELKAFAPELMKRIDEALSEPGMNLYSKSKFTHPWFGGMTPKQWYWLLSRHQGIHYRQAKEIVQRLNH